MISEKELKKEIEATQKFIKYLLKEVDKGQPLQDVTEMQFYLDALMYCLTGKLD
jgi:hypothetical protein